MYRKRNQPSRQAGSLRFNPLTKQWRADEAHPHSTREEVRKTALHDGFHAGFIIGFEVASVIGMIVGMVILGT
jgi:hypothetical protein